MTTSLVLTEPNAQFVMAEAKRRSLTKTRIINQALDLYRKYRLKKDLVDYFKSQTAGDLAEAMENFDDYLRIVDSEE